MKGCQFPFISNNCTTGHKLQGCSLETLLVNDWWYHGNWVYVVLSRIRTLKGLYLREKLSYDLTKYEMSSEMLTMIDNFKDSVAVEWLVETEYDGFERNEDNWFV